MAIIVPVVSTWDAKGLNKAIRDFKKLDGGVAKTGFGLRALDQGMGGLVKSFAKVGAGVAVAGAAIGYKLFTAAAESAKVMKITEGIIASTGAVAGITAQHVADLSEKLSEQTGIDDELIQSSANLLLSFTEVRNAAGANNDVFDRAVTASQDMAVMFGSSETAAKMLGMALTDPEAGMNKLKKAGILFTDEQKKVIKTLVDTGDKLGAQTYILDAVEGKVKGLAAASATDFDRMKVAVGNVVEQAGTYLIPIFEKMSRAIIDDVLPFVRDLVDAFGEEGLGGGLKFLAGGITEFLGNMGKTGNIIMAVVTALAALRLGMIAYGIATTVTSALMMAFGATSAAASAAAAPIALIAFAIVAVGVALVAAYLKFEGFRKVVNAVVNAVIGYIEFMLNMWIKGVNLFTGALNTLTGVLGVFGIDIPKIGKIGEVSFGRLSNAVDGTARGIAATTDRMNALAASFGKVASKGKDTAFIPTGGGGGKAVETVAEKMKKYTDQLEKVKDANAGATSSSKSLTDAQKSLANAGKAITDAQKNVTKATKAISDAQRDAVKASRAVTEAREDSVKATKAVLKAQNDLTDSVKSVAEAEIALEQIRKGFGSGSKQSGDAALKVSDAQASLEKSGYDLEGATYAVADAEAELAVLRASGTATAREIREGEIALAEAKLSLNDQLRDQQIQTATLQLAQQEFDEVTNGATEGNKAYDEALKAVNEAKKEMEERDVALAEAREAELDAMLAVEESLIAEEEARQKVTEAIEAEQEAKEKLTEAIDAEKEAVDKLRDANMSLRESLWAVYDAEVALRELKKTGGLTKKQINTAQANFDTRINTNPSNIPVRPFAEGGIVTKAMMGLVGEAGAEAIIPLSKLGSVGSNITINVNAGMGTDGADVGQQIIEAIRRAERRSGKVFATA